MNEPATIGLRSCTNRVRECTCGASVKWATTTASRPICLEAGANITKEADGLRVRREDVHWSRCPDAEKHRKPRQAAGGVLDAVEQIGKLRNQVRDLRVALQGEQAESTRLRKVLTVLAASVKAGATRVDIVQRIEAELAPGPRSEHVYPEGSRYAGD
ncbi:MAG: hypothetical protein JNK15_03050 [Planctomycetes bacterium]|nr:hypothetical protein [Planctomycetota bacterium]